MGRARPLSPLQGAPIMSLETVSPFRLRAFMGEGSEPGVHRSSTIRQRTDQMRKVNRSTSAPWHRLHMGRGGVRGMEKLLEADLGAPPRLRLCCSQALATRQSAELRLHPWSPHCTASMGHQSRAACVLESQPRLTAAQRHRWFVSRQGEAPWHHQPDQLHRP